MFTTLMKKWNIIKSTEATHSLSVFVFFQGRMCCLPKVALRAHLDAWPVLLAFMLITKAIR